MQDFVNKAPTNGETLTNMFKRITAFIDQLRTKKHSKVLIITHAGVIRCFWAYFFRNTITKHI